MDGASGRKIALQLNAEGIPAPRGAAWATSTIMGAAWNMSGILRVPQYHGEMFWNKTRYVKDPSTGKRVSRLNPREEWQHIEVPEMRIVDEDLWEAVQNRLKGTSRGGKGYQRRHRLLSGVLKCGVCGGGMAVTGRSASRDRVMCHRAREKGICSHKRSYFLDKIEERVLAEIGEALAEPMNMERAIDNFVDGQRKKIAGMAKVRAKAEGDVARAKARIDRLMDRHIDGELSLEDYRVRVAPLKVEHEAAKAALENVMKPPVVDVRADAVTRYKFLINNMRDMLNNQAERSAEFRDALRAMLHEVVVFETAPYAPVHVEVRGKMYDLRPDEDVAEEAVALA